MLRDYWDGNAKPSVEVPVGDFFGLNLGQYNIYQSAYLNCSSVKALNCYFAMPFRSRRASPSTNEGTQDVGVVLLQHRLSDRAVAAGRRAVFPRAVPAGTPNVASQIGHGREAESRRQDNYVYVETPAAAT